MEPPVTCAVDGCEDDAVRTVSIEGSYPFPLGRDGYRASHLERIAVRVGLCGAHYTLVTFNTTVGLSIG